MYWLQYLNKPVTQPVTASSQCHDVPEMSTVHMNAQKKSFTPLANSHVNKVLVRLHQTWITRCFSSPMLWMSVWWINRFLNGRPYLIVTWGTWRSKTEWNEVWLRSTQQVEFVNEFHERDVQLHCPAETHLNGINLMSCHKQWTGIRISKSLTTPVTSFSLHENKYQMRVFAELHLLVIYTVAWQCS